MVQVRQLLHTRLPLSLGPMVDSLALWLQGVLLTGNGCPGRVVAALAGRGATPTPCAADCAMG